MWTPNVSDPVVSLQAHLGPIRSLAIDPTGRYMVTGGADRQVCPAADKREQFSVQ